MSKPLLRQFCATRNAEDTLAIDVELVAENPCCDWSVQELADSTDENRHVALTIGDNVNERSLSGPAAAKLDFKLSRARNTRNLRVTVRRPRADEVTYEVRIKD